MKRKMISETKFKNIIDRLVRESLMENFFGNEMMTIEDDNKDKDKRLSDMNTEDDEDSETRDSIESFFKQPGVNCAPYSYKLYNVRGVEGEDTDDMKNARSKFMKCLNHEKNEAGYPYSFTSAELNTLKGMISSNSLTESINRAFDKMKKKLL